MTQVSLKLANSLSNLIMTIPAAEQAEAVEAMIINEAKEAGKRVGFQTAQLFIAEELEALILPDVSKVCEEAGKAKGQQRSCCKNSLSYGKIIEFFL